MAWGPGAQGGGLDPSEFLPCWLTFPFAKAERDLVSGLRPQSGVNWVTPNGAVQGLPGFLDGRPSDSVGSPGHHMKTVGLELKSLQECSGLL